MFSAEPWARAFIAAFPLTEDIMTEAVEALRSFCAAGLSVAGDLSGANSATHIAALIDRALTKTGMNAKTGGGAAQAVFYARNFFLLMVKKGCFYHYKKIVSRIQKLVNEKKGLGEAVLEAPFNADEVLLESIRQNIIKRTGLRGVEVKARVVPELIGGVRLRMESVLFDASLKTALDRMKVDLSSSPQEVS